MQVRFLDEARDELLFQISYYEERQKGLGERFRLAVQAATALALAHPKLGSPWKSRTRRVFAKKDVACMVLSIWYSSLLLTILAIAVEVNESNF